jgi:hypothetical protein
MRSFFIAARLALVFLAGCAAPKPVEYDAVPGPSQSKIVSPPSPAPAPVAQQKPAHGEKQKPAPVQRRKPASTIITPDASLSGKVSRCNGAFRFVVLEFPIAHLPGVGQKLFVYRDGLKVGEVKVTGPHRDDRTVADLTTGEAQPGDEVREQ